MLAFLLGDIPNNKLDLLLTGLVIALVAILGAVVYSRNKQSATNRAFLFLCMLTILWVLTDHFSYVSSSVTMALWTLRAHLFVAVWHSYALFHLA